MKQQMNFRLGILNVKGKEVQYFKAPLEGSKDVHRRYGILDKYEEDIFGLGYPIILPQRVYKFPRADGKGYGTIAPTIILVPDITDVMQQDLDIEGVDYGNFSIDEVMEAIMRFSDGHYSLGNTGIIVVEGNKIYYMSYMYEKNEVIPVVYEIEEDPRNSNYIREPRICNCNTARENEIFLATYLQTSQLFRERDVEEVTSL